MSTVHAPSISKTYRSKLTKPVRSQTIAPSATDPAIRRTVLLVDDDAAVLESLGRVLAAEGWEVILADGGVEALERIAEAQPDLIITDLSMAAVTGWDLLFHEKMQRPDLPIFVITALPIPVVGGADKFAHEFFQKPLDIDALLAAIRRYLGKPALCGIPPDCERTAIESRGRVRGERGLPGDQDEPSVGSPA